MARFQKHFPPWKNAGHWDLSPHTFSSGAEMLIAEMHTCVYTCSCVCVCVQGILITIPIHMCHVSIWTLLSDHMSGKSAPSNRIQAQTTSFYLELTCHLSDSRCQVKGLKLWGHAYTWASCWGSKRNKQTVTYIKLHMTYRVS